MDDEELFTRAADKLGPDATNEEIVGAALELVDDLPPDERDQYLESLIARTLAIHFFHKAVTALKDAVGEAKLLAAMSHAEALVGEERIQSVSESSLTTGYGNLQVADDHEDVPEVARRFSEFSHALTQLLEAT